MAAMDYNDSFMKITNINQLTLDIVNGYIKTCQQLLDKNNIYYQNIPSLIKHVCIIYYWIQECFTVHGAYITVNDSKTTAESNEFSKYTYDTVYGNTTINDKTPIIYKWTFKLNKLVAIAIGIDSSNKQFINKDFATRKNTFYHYSYGSDGYKYGYKNDIFISKHCAQMLKTDDIVIMKLNVLNKTLEYYINNKYIGIVFDHLDFNNDRQYNMAVMLQDQVNCVQLIDFQRNPIAYQVKQH